MNPNQQRQHIIGRVTKVLAQELPKVVAIKGTELEQLIRFIAVRIECEVRAK